MRQLKFHLETKELPVYSLIALKGGPKFQQPKEDEREGLRVAFGLLIGHKYDVSTFAKLLSGQLNAPVVDKAALSGIYDFEPKWVPAPNEEGVSLRTLIGTGPPLATDNVVPRDQEDRETTAIAANM